MRDAEKYSWWDTYQREAVRMRIPQKPGVSRSVLWFSAAVIALWTVVGFIWWVSR